MKRVLKIIAIGLAVLLVALFIFGWAMHQPLPKGTKEKEADVLATKMLGALNLEAFQNTRFLEWSYRAGANRYVWDRMNGTCKVHWKDNQVMLNLAHPKQSSILESNRPLNNEEEKKLISKVFKLFNNDSFWLVAPYKVFDEGAQRSVFELENGENGLLVTYTKGGTTPGDSYLWLLNENGFPRAFRMWVDIIPIGGLEATWDDWLVTETGAFLPKSHQLGPVTLSMGNVKGYNK